MKNISINNQVLGCIADTLGINIRDISLNDGIGSFPEWDSFGHISIYFAIQDRFDIIIPIEDAGAIKSVKDWIWAINKYST